MEKFSYSATAKKPLLSGNGLQVFRRPLLRDPILVMAVEGWNDGGDASSTAISWLLNHWDAQRFAKIEAEEFYVFTDTRPEIFDSKKHGKQISWPRNEFFYAQLPNSDHDVVLFLGVEPNLRWKTYAGVLNQVATSLGVKITFTLGSYFADVLHNNPVKVRGYSNDINLLEDYGIHRTGYQGPTGILSVCSELFRKNHFTSVSLWSAVPHYISMPNPKGAYALLDNLSKILKLKLNLGGWQEQIDQFDSEIEEIISRNPNMDAFVRELRKRALLS